MKIAQEGTKKSRYMESADQECKRQVQFIFWDSRTFFEYQRVNKLMDHFEACMLVNDVDFDLKNDEKTQSESNTTVDYFFAVMFTTAEHSVPFKLMKFQKKRSEGFFRWECV